VAIMAGRGAERAIDGGGAAGILKRLVADPPVAPYSRCLGMYDFDGWGWLCPPIRPYVVCASARSGSTWLCEELSWRTLAQPIEYLNPAYVEYLAWRWGCANLAQYRMMLWKYRTTADGVFGIKVLGMHFFDLHAEHFASLLDGDAPVDPELRRLAYLDAFVPGCTFVWLRRRDMLGQAVSWWLAERTGAWVQVTDDDRRDLASVEYDAAAIDYKLRSVRREDEQWARFFTRTGIEPFCVEYEELQEFPERVIGDLAVSLGGIRAPSGVVPERRNRLQRNVLTDRLVERYRLDLVSQQVGHGTGDTGISVV